MDYYKEAKKIWKKFEILLLIIIIVIGFAIAYWLAPLSGDLGDIVYNLGIFISTVFAVQLIYEIIFKKNDQEFYKTELIQIWEEKIPEIVKSGIIFYEDGRRPPDEKLNFYQEAEKEIIEVAATFHSFTTKFSSVPDSKFKIPILSLMKKGVNIKLYLLDPESESASAYQNCTPDNDDIINKVHLSIESLQIIIKELNESSDLGKMELYTYNYIPLLNGVFLDFVEDESQNSRAFVSHYLPYMEKRSENPGFSFTKKQNPQLFGKYSFFIKKLKENGKLVENL